MSTFLLLIIAILSLLIGLYLKIKYETRNFPPGLPSLPIVGCIPFLKYRTGARNMMDSVNLIPKYGDLIGYVFGTNTAK
jgi:hypothetical protein